MIYAIDKFACGFCLCQLTNTLSHNASIYIFVCLNVILAYIKNCLYMRIHLPCISKYLRHAVQQIFVFCTFCISYCVIQLGVSVTQYALIAFIYKLLSVSCSSFGSANATRYSTVVLFLFCGFHFHVVLCFPFFSVEILAI